MRDLITTGFEVVGLLLLAVAIVVAGWSVHPSVGLTGGALVLLTESWFLTRTPKPKADSG